VSPVAGAAKFGEVAMILWLLFGGVKPRPGVSAENAA
jgi:hypothetical protein